jgi:hypothetical protein
MPGDVIRCIRRCVPPIMRSSGSIGTVMQSDVKIVNQIENRNRTGVRPFVLCFLDDFVPECTEVMLQSRKCTAYVELYKCRQMLRVRWIEIASDTLSSPWATMSLRSRSGRPNTRPASSNQRPSRSRTVVRTLETMPCAYSSTLIIVSAPVCQSVPYLSAMRQWIPVIE